MQSLDSMSLAIDCPPVPPLAVTLLVWHTSPTCLPYLHHNEYHAMKWMQTPTCSLQWQACLYQGMLKQQCPCSCAAPCDCYSTLRLLQQRLYF